MLGSDPALWPARERREGELITHDKGYYHSLKETPSRPTRPTTLILLPQRPPSCDARAFCSTPRSRCKAAATPSLEGKTPEISARRPAHYPALQPAAQEGHAQHRGTDFDLKEKSRNTLAINETRYVKKGKVTTLATSAAWAAKAAQVRDLKKTFPCPLVFSYRPPYTCGHVDTPTNRHVAWSTCRYAP